MKTFRALCAEADFAVGGSSPALHGRPAVSTVITAGASGDAVPDASTLPGRATAQAATVNINIQLTLPASEDGKLYDAFFAAMKKHLFE